MEPDHAAASPRGRPGRIEQRAFVVQVAADCDPDTEELRGRVNHLATSDGGNFGSVDALLGIIRRILSEEGRGD